MIYKYRALHLFVRAVLKAAIENIADIDTNIKIFLKETVDSFPKDDGKIWTERARSIQNSVRTNIDMCLMQMNVPSERWENIRREILSLLDSQSGFITGELLYNPNKLNSFLLNEFFNIKGHSEYDEIQTIIRYVSVDLCNQFIESKKYIPLILQNNQDYLRDISERITSIDIDNKLQSQRTEMIFDEMNQLNEQIEKIHEELIEYTNIEKPTLIAPIPYLPDFFVMRPLYISAIEKSFKYTSPVFLWGEPGIGKTELSISYARQYNGNAFFTCFDTSIKNTIAALQFVGIGGDDNIDKLYELKMGMLRRLPRDTLLVIDNFDPAIGEDVDDLRNCKEYCDLIASGVRILFTTRTNYECGIHVKALSMEKLLELMLHYYPYPEKKEQLELLIKIIDKNTLIAELCARTLNSINSINIETMIDDIQNDIIIGKKYEGVYSHKDRMKYGMLKRINLATHIKSLFKINDLSKNEKQVLSCASLIPINGLNYHFFIDCDPILSRLNGVQILEHDTSHVIVQGDNYSELFMLAYPLGRVYDNPGFFWEFLTTSDEVIKSTDDTLTKSASVVNNLIQRGWLKIEPTTMTIKIHPFLKSAIMDDEEICPDAKQCMAFIKTMIRFSQPENINEDKSEYPIWCVETLDNVLKQLKIEDEFKSALSESIWASKLNLAISFDNTGSDYTKNDDPLAEQFLLTASILFDMINASPKDKGINYDNLSDYYRRQKQYEDSILYNSLAIDEFQKGVYTDDLLIAYRKKIKIYLEFMNKIDEAFMIFDELVKKITETYKNDCDVILARNYMEVGVILDRINETDKALEFHMKAYNYLYDSYERSFSDRPNDIPNCLEILYNSVYGLINCYEKKGDYKEVEYYKDIKRNIEQWIKRSMPLS